MNGSADFAQIFTVGSFKFSSFTDGKIILGVCSPLKKNESQKKTFTDRKGLTCLYILVCITRENNFRKYWILRNSNTQYRLLLLFKGATILFMRAISVCSIDLIFNDKKINNLISIQINLYETQYYMIKNISEKG